MRYETEADRKRQKLILRFLQYVGIFDFFKETNPEEQNHFDSCAYINDKPTWLEVKWYNCRSDKHTHAIIPVSKYESAQKLAVGIQAWYVVKYEDKVVLWDLRDLPTYGRIEKPRKDRVETDPVFLINIKDAKEVFPIEIF